MRDHEREQAAGEAGRRAAGGAARDFPVVRSEQGRQLDTTRARIAAPVAGAEAERGAAGGADPEGGQEQQRHGGVLGVRGDGGAGSDPDPEPLLGGSAPADLPDVRSRRQRLHHRRRVGAFHGQVGPRAHGGGAHRNDQGGRHRRRRLY